jgi:hypothetical protein
MASSGTSVRILIALPVESSKSFFRHETRQKDYTASHAELLAAS